MQGSGESHIAISEPATIDDDVLIGYVSARPIETDHVVIGKGAVVRSGSVIYRGVTIGERFQAGHNVVVREENVLGDDVNVWTNSVIDYRCRIGNRVKVHTNVYIAQYSVLEDDVFVAPGTTFANDKYPMSEALEGPIVRAGARIGVNVTILPGVTIGIRAMVGAGSVVTKDIGDGLVAVGNPAVVVSDVDTVDRKRDAYLAAWRERER